VSGMIAATLPLPDLAKLLSCFKAEKLLVNDFVVSFGAVAFPLAAAVETVNPAAAMAPTTVRLASLPSFFVRTFPPLSGHHVPYELL
jgi:hypothetical protein